MGKSMELEKTAAEMICYSCYDDAHFQLFGQTERYWKEKDRNAREFLSSYLTFGCPTIQCELCGQTTRYVLGEDGIWTEEIQTIEKELGDDESDVPGDHDGRDSKGDS